MHGVVESEPWLITYPTISGYEYEFFPFSVEVLYNEGEGVYQYTSPLNGKVTQGTIQVGETIEICSLTRPIGMIGKMTIGPGNYNVWRGESYKLNCFSRGWGFHWRDPFTDDNSAYVDRYQWLAGYLLCNAQGQTVEYGRVDLNGPMPYETGASEGGIFESGTSIELQGRVEMPPGEITTRERGRISTLGCKEEKPQTPIEEIDPEERITDRQIFNSPETSFGQPFLGSVLKLESVMFGAGKAHWVQVKDNANYKLLSKEAQLDALDSSRQIADLGGFNAGAMFTAYQAYLTIYVNGITRKNYAMSFNSRANYDYSYPIDNGLGIKQRDIDLTRYLIPGVQSLGGDELSINKLEQRNICIY